MRAPTRLRVPQGIDDRVVNQAVGDVRDKLTALVEGQREFAIAIPLLTDVKAVTECPIYSAEEACELVAAYIAPDAASGAFATTAFSIRLFHRNGSGGATQQIAYFDRTAASSATTPWRPFKSRLLALPSGTAAIAPGDVVSMATSNNGVIASWRGALSLRFRRIG